MQILSAKYANAEGSIIDALTDEVGSVLIPLTGNDTSGGWQTTFQEWLLAGGEAAAYVAPDMAANPTAHFAAHGYDVLALLNLADLERKITADGSELPPKCAAVRAWIDGVQIAYATGAPLPTGPHTLSEVLEELAPILIQLT